MTPISYRLLKDAKEGRDRAHGLEPGHALACLLQAGVERRVGQHHELGRLVMRPRVLLDEARDADALLGEDLADRGQHARFVVDADPVIRTCLDLADGDDADAIVEAERRPALHAPAAGPARADQTATDT